jgi:hypothetical protein
MKKTLLQIVQDILTSMDADEVTSILDTHESEQVAVIVRDTYYFLANDRNWPHQKELVQLTETTASTPTHVTLPTSVKELISLNYDMIKAGETQKKYLPIYYVHPDEFLRITNAYNNDSSNIDVVTDPSGAELLIRNDHRPRYWTSFDDDSIVLDSYDSGVDTYIKAAKLQVHAVVTPTWTHDDSFTPDLPEEAFNLLLEDAKSACFLELKQMVNEKAESRAKKADTWLSRKSFRAKGGVRYPHYGRTRNFAARHKPHPLEKDN